MPANDASSRRRLLLYTIEAIFVTLLAVAAIGCSLYSRHVEYVGGLNNRCGEGAFAAIGVRLLVALVTVVFAIWAIIQLSLPPHTLRHTLLRVVFLIVPPVALVGGFAISTPLAIHFLRGFERWVLREVDTDAIQQWLAAEGRNYAGRQYSTWEGFPKELPDFLVRFKPQFISFRDSPSEGGPCVEFEWGTVLSRWGLIVGLPDMPTPKEGAIDLSESETEFRRPIKPGVYAVDRG